MLTAGNKSREVLSSKVRDIRPRFVQLDDMGGFVPHAGPNLNEGDPEECKVKIRTCVILAACLDCCREPYAQPESAVSPLLPLQTAGDT
jgi:hypothetical protein